MVPAHAGMVRFTGLGSLFLNGGPRARGDGPRRLSRNRRRPGWSPRTRGWSPPSLRKRAGQRVVPAHAGMVLFRVWVNSDAPCGPRARGDGPAGRARTRTRTEWSPRTRGWSRGRARADPEPRVVPAHAGMVPLENSEMDKPTGGPRARGDGPYVKATCGCNPAWSPRTRGWSHGDRGHAEPGGVVPAHAGMVPQVAEPGHFRGCGPRARGDGPASRLTSESSSSWSPRTRGWSPVLRGGPAGALVVPAHAGMVPGLASPRVRPAGGPRARGDGPFHGQLWHM